MAKDPAVLFYTADFLSTIQGLTLEEIGTYIKLLCIQHQIGHLSEKTVKLSVGEVSPDVLRFFKKDENGHLYNERMEKEQEKRRVYSDRRRKNRTKKDMKNICLTYVEHMENENVNENVNETKNKYGAFENVLLTLKEYERLKEKYPHTYEKHIDNLSYYIESRGDKYKSHYATILAWTRKEEKERGDSFSSFDTDEFFQAAVERSAKRIRERAKCT
ncbi:MAG: hypothetical protein IJD42_06550 [Clostridia bacterium]|nr:hypothetical protein [Clostridia bacterium]